jgi:hypothetical protein
MSFPERQPRDLVMRGSVARVVQQGNHPKLGSGRSLPPTKRAFTAHPPDPSASVGKGGEAAISRSLRFSREWRTNPLLPDRYDARIAIEHLANY